VSQPVSLILINTPWETPLRKGYYYPSLGICYIATYLKRHLQDEIKIAVIDGLFENSIEKIIKKIKEKKPDVIGISSTTLEFANAIEIAQKIQKDFFVPVIVGGVHISALPHTLPKCFNIGVIGEGEQAMLELMQLFSKYKNFPAEKLKKINGIVFRNKNKVTITAPRLHIEPLDKIPHPNLDYFDMEYYLRPRQHLAGVFGRGTHIITSRGCPYKCVFCGGSHFWKTVRFHSANYVIEEIRNLINRYDVDCINILDDLFAASKQRLIEISKLIKEEKINKKVKFGCQMRADLLNDEMAKLLKEMNVVYLGFGLESGSEKILNYLKRGTVTVEENKKGIEIANKYGFKTGSGFMIGNPNETMKDLEKTYNFIISNPLDTMGMYITTPLPGTELWCYAKDKGIVSENMDWSQLNQFFFETDKILSDMELDEFKKALSKLQLAASLSSLKKRNPILLVFQILKIAASILKRNPREIPGYFSLLMDLLITGNKKHSKIFSDNF